MTKLCLWANNVSQSEDALHPKLNYFERIWRCFMIHNNEAPIHQSLNEVVHVVINSIMRENYTVLSAIKSIELKK